jgi:putative SOS response-associated peptidase YedK
MCGRYAIVLDAAQLEAQFGAQLEGNMPPNFNAAPAQNLPVITNENPGRVQFFRWGLLPDWAKEENAGYKMINARMEGITEKPSFRKAIRQQRCLVPANSFYEWRAQGKVKIPFSIRPTDQDLFAFAGIWNRWVNRETGEEIPTFAIITMEANPFMRQLHDRMPAVLPADVAHRWINPKVSFEEAFALLQPYSASRMRAAEVSRDVNKVGNNGPELVKPAGEVLEPLGEERRAAGA